MIRITNDHLKLLEKAEWQWNDSEYGAPEIDCKRPYGNSSVENDIAEILGWEIGVNQYDERDLTKQQADKAYEIHHELLDVVQQIIKEYITNFRQTKVTEGSLKK